MTFRPIEASDWMSARKQLLENVGAEIDPKDDYK
jgi:hypothetical protein